VLCPALLHSEPSQAMVNRYDAFMKPSSWQSDVSKVTVIAFSGGMTQLTKKELLTPHTLLIENLFFLS
jgi:hypothetical protein